MSVRGRQVFVDLTPTVPTPLEHTSVTVWMDTTQRVPFHPEGPANAQVPLSSSLSRFYFPFLSRNYVCLCTGLICKLTPQRMVFLEDVDECLEDVCGKDGTCHNNPGSYICECHKGFVLVPEATPVCQGTGTMS